MTDNLAIWNKLGRTDPDQTKTFQRGLSGSVAEQVETVKALLSYDPLSGEFYWRVARGRAAGSLAGTIIKNGYVSIGINGRHYYAHRIAFLITHGAWPCGDIDHINGNRADNRAANLREATRSQNLSNRRTCSRNTSGAKGVSWNGRRRKWEVYISENKRRKIIGFFDSLETAAAARREAEVEIFGQFARQEA